VIARVLVALVAVVALAWLGVMERDARLLADGGAAAGRPGTAGDLPRAESAFRRAGLLNPDTRPDVLEAAMQSRQGRNEQALARLEAVLRSEPDNLGAWSVLAAVGREDPAIARRVRAARARLDPVNARR
jgi:tetratricopeptide (TPR) repeat protein